MYKAPLLWKDSTVYIIGGGPSVTGLDLCLPPINNQYGLKAYLGDKHVIGINNAMYLGDWIDVLYFGDAKWYWWNRDSVKLFMGIKISSNMRLPERDKDISKEPEINILPKGKLRGLETRREYLAWNRSSGGAAVNLAVHLGAVRIVLIGYDMKNIAGQKNFMKHEQEKTNQNPYDFQREGFNWIADACKNHNIEVLNASPVSSLTQFKKVKLEDVI